MTVITEQQYHDQPALHLARCHNQQQVTVITSAGFLTPAVDERLVLMIPLSAYPEFEEMLKQSLTHKKKPTRPRRAAKG